MAPTLLANAINAGSPFATTYGDADVMPPEFSFGVIWQLRRGHAIRVAGAGEGMDRSGCCVRVAATASRQVALVTAGNLLVNLAFFMSHPVFTPYYTIPVAMLSLWSLLFASLMQPAEVVDDDLSWAGGKSLIMHMGN